MTSCYVCQQPTAAAHEHHLIPQSRGGAAGPTVFLCPTHHQSVHSAALAALAGRDYAEYLPIGVHAAKRFELVVKVLLIAEARGTKNPNPLLTTKLGRPEYMAALHLAKIDGGYTSIDAMLNALAHRVAVRYGLISASARTLRAPR